MKYNPALDGIRALAVLAVVAAHTAVPGMEAGKWGVDVFFVLSGYLITTLLRQEAEATGTIRLRAFYLRRVRRLYPALLTMLVLFLVCYPLSWARARDALFAALYLTDYTTAFLHDVLWWHTDDAIGHTWSLSVEEHFYLIWPFVVIGLARVRTRRFVVYGLGAAYLLSTWWRLWSFVEIGTWETYCRFDTRTSGLLLGALLTYLPSLKHRARAWAVPVLVYLTWHLTADGIPQSLPILPAEWAGAALVLWALAGSRLLALPPLVYTGRISYGLYLYHWPIAYVWQRMEAPWWQALPITVVAAFLIAHYSHRYIESPIMRGYRPQWSKNAAEGGVKAAV